MRDREGVMEGDEVRFKAWLKRYDRDMDQAEEAFWTSVGRILSGGEGFGAS